MKKSNSSQKGRVMNKNNPPEAMTHDAAVMIDDALRRGQLGYLLEPGTRYYITTPRYDLRGTVDQVGPLGFSLVNCERIFRSGELGDFLKGGEANYAEPLRDGTVIAWSWFGEATPLDVIEKA